MKRIFFALLAFAFISGAFASAQIYSSATYVTQPQHQASFQTYYGAQASTYWPILNDKEQCKDRQDFILQVALAGCQPSVVRSDLLAEQNVPVFCQINAMKINPLLDVKEIRSIRFERKYPPGVAAVGFHPARAALRTRDRLLGDPVINNIGYAVVVLQKNPQESTLPEFVTVNLTGTLEYDAGNALGIGRTEFVLEEQTDQAWEDKSQRQSFWNGRYSVRLLHADAQRAELAIYSGERRVATTSVERGKRSGEMFVPGSYCRAALYADYTAFEAAQTTARLALGSANSTELIDVYEGSRLFDGRCTVTRIRLDNTSVGTGNVSMRCPSTTLELQLRPKSATTFDVFVNSDGSKSFPYREGSDYLVELGNKQYNLTASDVLYVYVGGTWVRASAANTGQNQAFLQRLREATITYRQLERSEGSVLTSEIVIDQSWKDVVGVEGNFSAALDAFERVVRNYPAEKISVEGTTYGQTSLQRAIALATFLNKEQQRLRLLQLYVDRYPAAIESDAYLQELTRSEHIDFSHSASALTIDQRFRSIRVVSIREPREMSTTTIAIGARVVTLRAGEKHEFPSEHTGKPYTFSVQRIENDYISVSTTCKATSRERFTSTLRVGQSTIACGQPIVVQRIDVQRAVRITLTPQAWGSETSTNLTVRIGIEKRAIQLAPNATLSKIATINASIRKWEQISTNLGNVVSGLKGACFATAGTLTIKNFVTGLSGTGFSRQQVMRGERGWTARCQAEVSRGAAKSLDACFSNHASEINRDVERADARMQEVNSVIKNNVESQVPKTEGFLSSSIDPSQAVPKYREYLLTEHGGKDIQIKDRQGVRMVKVRDLLQNSKGYEDGEYSYESLRELHYNLLLKEDGGISAGSKENAEQRLETVGSTISVNHALTQRYKQEQSIRAQGFAAPFTATASGQVDRYVDIVPAGNLKQTWGDSIFADKDVTHSATVVVPPRKDLKTGADYSGGTYIIGVSESGDGAHTVREVVKKEGEGAEAVYRTADASGVINAGSFVNTYGIGTLYSQQMLTYFNKYENPEVRFYDREPYKGMPAIVPIDIQKGWYAATKQTLPVFGGVGAFDASGRVTSFWLCNVGANHREQFNEGLGDDICEMVNFQTGQPISTFPGLSEDEARLLVRRARDKLEEAARQHGNSRITLTGLGDVRLGKPAISVPALQCHEFMSPGECNLIFNLCDPVICPATRCDFGGKYPVADVAQTGIIGSTLLCLPNFPQVKIPVCLTGIHAGIDSYVSILKAHRDCLQESVKSGKLVGICDQIYSIYTCEFFWRQLAPLAKVLVPRLLETAFGQNVRGGGEYLTVMGAWNNMQQSIGYFTQVYGVNSFKAFQARSVEEVGGEFCKSFISIRAPTSIKTVLAPDSPPQFHAYFSSTKFSDVTVPATAHYKVYYHLYAGKDQGAYYRVYLKSPPDSSYYSATPVIHVASGFVKRGEYKDETRDFPAPEGYAELCVNLNGEEHCGFKQVSTSFAVNYVRDALVAEQIKESTITSEKECISGSTSATALLNPNVQQAAQEAITPELYRRGVVRICATQNPGTGTDPTRFVPVGRCDGEKVQCWLDKKSVEHAISDNNRGIRNGTLQELERVQREHLEKGGVLFTDNVSTSELNALGGMLQHLERSFGARSGGGVSSAETVEVQAILGRARAVRPALYLNHHHAHLLHIEGSVHAAVASQLAEEKLLRKVVVETAEQQSAAKGEVLVSERDETAQTEVAEFLTIPFILDLNPGGLLQNAPGIDQKLVVQYNEYDKTWKHVSETAAFPNALSADIMKRLQTEKEFIGGFTYLLARTKLMKGAELQTSRVTYRAGEDDFQVIAALGNGDATYGYREGIWGHYDQGQRKFVTSGVPSGSSEFADVFYRLKGLDRDAGARYLFSLSSDVVRTPDVYTLRSGTTPNGVRAEVVYAGETPLDIYLVGEQFFIRVQTQTTLERVGRISEEKTIEIQTSAVHTTAASDALKQHVLSLNGYESRELRSGSIRVISEMRASAGESKSVETP